MWPQWPEQLSGMRDLFAMQRRMLDDMERWLDQTAQVIPPLATPSEPPVFHDNGDHWLFRAHLPGADKDSLKLSVRDGWLQLQAHAQKESRLEAPGLQQMAQQSGYWHWNMPLPADVRAGAAEPTWSGDSVELKLPKAK